MDLYQGGLVPGGKNREMGATPSSMTRAKVSCKKLRLMPGQMTTHVYGLDSTHVYGQV